MFSQSWICIFIKWCSVKHCKSVSIFWEVGRYPVQNNPDSCFMESIYQIHKILRCSISWCRCIISHNLISPWAIKRMFQYTHKFYMSISHILNICYKFFSHTLVIIESVFIIRTFKILFPWTRMNLIDWHWKFIVILLCLLWYPFSIFPFVIINICYPWSISGSFLSPKTIRISLVQCIPTLCRNNILVHCAFFNLRYEKFPDAWIIFHLHVMVKSQPVIKITYNGNVNCMGCPNCEICSFYTINCCNMCTQFLIYFIMSTFSKQITVIFCYDILVSHMVSSLF